MLLEAGQLIDTWTKNKMFSIKSLCCSLCCFITATSMTTGQSYQTCCSSYILVTKFKRWSCHYMLAFQFLGHSHTTKPKGKEKWKSIPVAHARWAYSYIHICNTHMFNGHWFWRWRHLFKIRCYSSSFFFSIPAAQEPNALRARPRSRYCFHSYFRKRHMFLWC